MITNSRVLLLGSMLMAMSVPRAGNSWVRFNPSAPTFDQKLLFKQPLKLSKKQKAKRKKKS